MPEDKEEKASGGGKEEKEKFKLLKDLANFIVKGEASVAKEYSKESADYLKLERKNSQEKLGMDEQVQDQKKANVQRFAESFGMTSQDAANMGMQMGQTVAGAFEQFTTNVITGEMSLLSAIGALGKALLKGIINAIGDALINKGIEFFVIAFALLAGIFTAALSGNWFAAGGMLLAIGIGLKMLAAAFLAEGGLVVRPTLAMVGEGGQPEAVIPADRFAEFGLGSGLDLNRLKAVFPDMSSLKEASKPAFRMAVAKELQAAYAIANRRRN